MAKTMLTGLLELNGIAMAGRRVLLISEDMNRLLQSTVTDDSGVFRFALDDPAESTVVVLAKIQRPVLSIAYRAIELARHGPGPHKISIDSSSQLFHSVKGQIDWAEGRPPYLLLHVDPEHLTGIPAPLEKFFRTIDEDVIESSFYQQRLDGDSFEIRVQNGVYRLSAEYFNKWELPEDEDTRNYSLQQVTPDGEEMVQFESSFESFHLHVDRERTVRMSVGPVKE